MEEKMMLQLEIKILKELQEGNKKKLSYKNLREIKAIKELKFKKLIGESSEEFFICDGAEKFINENQIKIPYLPLDLDLETKKIMKQLSNSRGKLGELKGLAKTIPNSLILINTLTLQEAKGSSEIENIITTTDDLYRAEISNVGINYATKEVQNYRKALIDGFKFIEEKKEFDIEFIIGIQKNLEEDLKKQGLRKDFGKVVMNQSTNKILHIPPQNYKDIYSLLENLVKYIKTDDEVDSLIKLAIVHHQFETIHPFPDGNGRTGRIINILYLIYKGFLDYPVLYLSSYLIRNKAEYYRLLQKVRDENSWEEWILFILKGIEETSEETIDLINKMKIIMDETKKEIQDKTPKIYSKDLLESLFIHPYTKIKFISDNLSITEKTASSYLQQLSTVGILDEIQLGRDKFFINKKLYELFLTR